jgi:transaldolase
MYTQIVVCDSGDFATIDRYKSQDASTNPSLILAASKKPEYAKLIDAVVAWGKTHGDDIDDQVDATLDSLLVQFGKVSTEVDARFSFDTEASVNKALRIIDVGLVFRGQNFTGN